jgi:hypothetical protein
LSQNNFIETNYHLETAAPAKKKAKTCSGSTPAAPNVSVIEIDDESDDEPAKTGKRAPRATRGSIFTCQFLSSWAVACVGNSSASIAQSTFLSFYVEDRRTN